ncbi:unnamed protein product [Protopolystoma xenopodis]|uniref:Uncharacterized protein n=1 Tax=Protopolystoma xenopodis TaxID=117903 RepID=A0A448XQR4_9PLAT|nr:unnamed protein product [Protopolystoma xenopodis]
MGRGVRCRHDDWVIWPREVTRDEIVAHSHVANEEAVSGSRGGWKRMGPCPFWMLTRVCCEEMIGSFFNSLSSHSYKSKLASVRAIIIGGMRVGDSNRLTKQSERHNRLGLIDDNGTFVRNPLSGRGHFVKLGLEETFSHVLFLPPCLVSRRRGEPVGKWAIVLTLFC